MKRLILVLMIAAVAQFTCPEACSNGCEFVWTYDANNYPPAYLATAVCV